MLKGDLITTPLASLLLELASDASTGCLVIIDVTDEEALVYFKAGLIYSVSVPGSRPQLGAKLVSSGALAPEALAEALEAQRSELQGWRLGELLVHLGYVEQPVVEAFIHEQVSEAIWDLLRWSEGRWKFRKNIKAREDVGPPLAVADLLSTLRERGYEWETISAIVHGPAAIPRLSTRGDTSSQTTLDNDAWSMLCKIDGERTVADLAADCGYTLFEAGNVIVSLVQAGLVDIDEDVDVEGSELYGATTLSSALSGELDEDTAEFTPDDTAEEDAMSKLARLVHEVAGNDDTDTQGAADESGSAQAEPTSAKRELPPPQRASDDYENPMTVSVNRHAGESFAASIARVSGALSEVLGEVPPPDIDPAELASRRRAAAESDDGDRERRKRLRSAAAAELADAQAMIETLRPDQEDAPDTTPEFTGVPKVVSTEAERERAAARAAEDATRHAAEETGREAAEQFARAAAEQAEQEAARQAALQAEEQVAETETVDTETVDTETVKTETIGTEFSDPESADEVAAPVARDEPAEDDAAHDADAEPVTAAQDEQESAEHDAAEETDHVEREESDRVAAEEAAQQAAELEAEQAAAVQAAEDEADRLAVEHAKQSAAEEAARVEAEEEAAREAHRAAEREEALDAARREDEAAAATALLSAFTASADQEPVDVTVNDAPADTSEPGDESAPEEDADADVLEPVSVGGGWSDADSTDTAALLRELSSLGHDDDQSNGNGGGAAAPRARPQPGADKKAKKKIGLFGL